MCFECDSGFWDSGPPRIPEWDLLEGAPPPNPLGGSWGACPPEPSRLALRARLEAPKPYVLKCFGTQTLLPTVCEVASRRPQESCSAQFPCSFCRFGVRMGLPRESSKSTISPHHPNRLPESLRIEFTNFNIFFKEAGSFNGPKWEPPWGLPGDILYCLRSVWGQFGVTLK